MLTTLPLQEEQVDSPEQTAVPKQRHREVHSEPQSSEASDGAIEFWSVESVIG